MSGCQLISHSACMKESNHSLNFPIWLISVKGRGSSFVTLVWWRDARAVNIGGRGASGDLNIEKGQCV